MYVMVIAVVDQYGRGMLYTGGDLISAWWLFDEVHVMFVEEK